MPSAARSRPFTPGFSIPFSVSPHSDAGSPSGTDGSDPYAGLTFVNTQTLSGNGTVSADYGSDIVGGYSWGSGGFVASVDYQKDNSLFARNRSFSANLSDPWALSPQDDSIHLYGSVHQHFTDELTFYTDVLFTRRNAESQNNIFLTPSPVGYSSSIKQAVQNRALLPALLPAKPNL